MSHRPAGVADATARQDERKQRADQPQSRDDSTVAQQSASQRCASQGHGTNSTTSDIQRMNDKAEPSSDSQPANRIDRADSVAESKMIEVPWTPRCRQKRPIGNEVVCEASILRGCEHWPVALHRRARHHRPARGDRLVDARDLVRRETPRHRGGVVLNLLRSLGSAQRDRDPCALDRPIGRRASRKSWFFCHSSPWNIGYLRRPSFGSK